MDNELVSKLQTRLKKGDVLFTMGAGDVYKLKDEIIKLKESMLQAVKERPSRGKRPSRTSLPAD